MRFLGSKYVRNAFAPAGGAYSAPPDLLAGFNGPTSKGRGEGREGWMGGKGGGKGRGGEGEREERGGKGGEGERFDPHFSLPSDAPA